MEIDYPTYDEEFELAYQDDLALLDEMGDYCESEPTVGKIPKSKRSLNFGENQPDNQQNGETSQSTERCKDNENLSSSPPLIPVLDDLSASVRSSQLLGNAAKKQCLNTEKDESQETRVRNILSNDINKRKLREEDLFGDITDINFDLDDDIQRYITSKRSKTCSNDEMEEMLIDRINATRKENAKRLKQTRIFDDSPMRDRIDKGESATISKRVPQWPFIPVTTSYGNRWYVRQWPEDLFNMQISRIAVKGRGIGLLNVSFQSIKSQAEALVEKQLKKNQIDEFERKIRALEEYNDSGISSEEEREDSAVLWVEKYKPKSYLELLSDENVNRLLLQWLKQWDKVVFNREKKVKVKQKEEKHKDKPDNRFQKKNIASTINEEFDEHGCPKQKIALLCGPPGLGKTTLAHMVAKHAGYNVVEMNASDDRSPELFRNQLQAATQMKAVMGEDRKPNCLVLDEIDGAPVASIEALIKFVTGKDAGKGKGKKKAQPIIVRRPVICICNDVYTPALRPLRQIALIINFPPTASTRLAQRLLEICHKQKIKTDLGTLLALAEKSQNDIRSCVSVLHFYKGKQLKLIDVQKSNVGEKDMQKGLFRVWQEIFQIQKTKRRVGESDKYGDGVAAQGDDMSDSTRMRNILQTVQGFGDYERLAQGVYENFPNLNSRDSQMFGTLLGMEWFCTFDVINTRVHSSQNYVLTSYLPFAFVLWHFLFSSLSWPKITYPSASYEANVKETRCKQILRTLMEGMQPAVRAFTPALPLVLDTLPLLRYIIVPSLRPVNIQLYSLKEKEALKNVVDRMIDYNLNYVQDCTPEGSYVFILEPNIDVLCQFDENNKKDRGLTYATKQAVSHQIELEKMRRSEIKTDEKSKLSSDSLSKKSESEKDKQKTNEENLPSSRSVPNHLQTLQPKEIQEGTRVAKDFFGRVIQQKQSEKEIAEHKDEIVKSDIWYRFKEGYSNAVRTTVKMRDLI